MKKPAKTIGELEHLIRAELEQTCTLPIDTVVSVEPDRDTWKAVIKQEGPHSDSGLTEMINLICGRLRSEYDLLG